MLQPGDRIGPYRIEDTIGSGGFATVFAAADDRLRNRVAIKVLADNHAASPDLRRRFFDEGHLLRKSASDALVTIYDVGEQDGQPYLVLDYCDRGDLASRVAERSIEPSIDDVRLLIGLLGTALGDLEALGIAHRDIKPSNVLLASRPTVPVDGPSGDLRVFDADDRLLLSDLGLAKNLAAGSGITLGAGTGSFAAPEQREWLGTISSSTDIHGASALIHWFVAGRPPRHDQPGVMTLGDGAIAAGYEGAIQAALQPALVKGMSTDPQDRHSSAREWSSDLLGRLDGLAGNVVAPPDSAGGPEPIRLRRSPSPGLLLVGLLTLGLLVARATDRWPLGGEASDQAEPVPSTDATPAENDPPAESTVDGALSAEPAAPTVDLNLKSPPVALSADGTADSLVAEVLVGLDRIEDRIAFSEGSVALSASTLAVLEELASTLAPGPLVELRGFDDGDSNPVLGEERARAVHRMLVDVHGLPEQLLLVTGTTATTVDQQGSVATIVADRDDGGLLLSRWPVTPNRWDQPADQLTVPGLRSFAGNCESPCAIQIEGLLTPLEDGEHTFALLGEQPAELWLSQSADPADLRPFIAVQSAATSDDGSPVGDTGSLLLDAGQSIYVRLRTVHETPVDSGADGSGGVVVAWQTPFGDGPEWISSTVLAPPEQP